MKLTEKKLPEGKIELTAEATAAEVDSAFKSAYLAFVNRMGLQPEQGKTVNQVVEEKLGIKDLDGMVRESALENLIPLAIDRSGLMPAFPPSVSKADKLNRGAKAKFVLEIFPKVRYELTSYDPVDVTVPPFEVDMSLVDRQLEQIAARSPEYVRASEQHEVRSGDSVLLTMESFENGKRVPGLSSAKRTYVCGKGFMPAGFDDGIIGMMPGETKSFTFEGPDVDAAGNETTTTIDTTVTVLELQEECIPAINEAWLARNMPMFKTVEDLRADITKSLEAKSREEYDAHCRQLAIFQLADRFQGSIPDEAYEAMRENLLQGYQTQMKAQGISFKELVDQQGGEQQFSMMLMMEVRSMLVEGYALDALYAHEKLKATEQDYLEAARQINPNVKPEQTRQQLEATGRSFILRETAERHCASVYLLDHANITVRGE